MLSVSSYLWVAALALWGESGVLHHAQPDAPEVLYKSWHYATRGESAIAPQLLQLAKHSLRHRNAQRKRSLLTQTHKTRWVQLESWDAVDAAVERMSPDLVSLPEAEALNWASPLAEILESATDSWAEDSQAENIFHITKTTSALPEESADLPPREPRVGMRVGYISLSPYAHWHQNIKDLQRELGYITKGRPTPLEQDVNGSLGATPGPTTQKSQVVIPNRAPHGVSPTGALAGPQSPPSWLPIAAPVLTEGVPSKGNAVKVLGSVSLDDSLDSLIQSQNLSMELALVPLNDSQSDPKSMRNAVEGSDRSRILLNYHYPETALRDRVSLGSGSYALMASFFSPEGTQPIAEVPLQEVSRVRLSGQEARTPGELRVSQRVSVADFRRGALSQAASAQAVPVTLALFDGIWPDKLQSTPIVGARIEFLGFGGALPTLFTNDAGVARIRLPADSEFALRITHPSFLTTTETLVVKGNAPYQRVFLLSQTKIDALHGLIPQARNPDLAVLMGRVEDPEEGSPEKDAGVEARQIGARTEATKPVYLTANLFPDRALHATSANGLFGFLNLRPSYWHVSQRDGSSLQNMVALRQGEGHFIELGGERHALRLQFVDPFVPQGQDERPALPLEVHWPATPAPSYETDAQNKVEISDLNLPTQVLTLELSGDRYPLTWLSLPWVQNDSDERIFRQPLLPVDFLVHAASRNRMVQESNLGWIAGGIAGDLFRQAGACVSLQLTPLDLSTSMRLPQGPFGLEENNMRDSAGVQEKSCLTPASRSFVFFNVAAGEYQFSYWDKFHRLLRTHFIRVGKGRLTLITR